MKNRQINWFEDPEDHNFPAAESYLNLIYPLSQARVLRDLLEHVHETDFKAKDIFRASGLSLLGISNSHVKSNNKKIRKGEKISPILLVRDPKNGKVIIADGYHRLCAVYHYHEDAMIPCRIVTLVT